VVVGFKNALAVATASFFGGKQKRYSGKRAATLNKRCGTSKRLLF